MEIRADFRSYPVGARPDGRWKYALTLTRMLLEVVPTGEGNTRLLSFESCWSPSRRAMEIRTYFDSYVVGARPDGRWKYTLTFVRILLEPVLTGDGNTR